MENKIKVILYIIEDDSTRNEEVYMLDWQLNILLKTRDIIYKDRGYTIDRFKFNICDDYEENSVTLHIG